MATDSGYGIWTRGVCVVEGCDVIGEVIGISLIGGRSVVEDRDKLYLLVEELSHILEVGLVGGVVTLRG